MRELQELAPKEDGARDGEAEAGGVLAWPPMDVLAAAGLMRAFLTRPGGCGCGSDEVAAVTRKAK